MPPASAGLAEIRPKEILDFMNLIVESYNPIQVLKVYLN
jgi:hypothetical protein